MNNDKLGHTRDKQGQYYYNEAQVFLMQYQKHQGIVTSAIQYATYAKAFELLAHADLEGLQREVERLIKEQLNS